LTCTWGNGTAESRLDGADQEFRRVVADRSRGLQGGVWHQLHCAYAEQVGNRSQGHERGHRIAAQGTWYFRHSLW
jgi:hypothetical protein